MCKKLYSRLLALLLIILMFTGVVTAVNVSSAATISGVTNNNLYYTLYDEGAVIIEYTGSSSSVSIPSNILGYPVIGIGSNAFADKAYLQSVSIPGTVTFIDTRAFAGCTGISYFYIPSSVVSIGQNAFYNTGVYNRYSNWSNGALYVGNALVEVEDSYTGDFTVKTYTSVIADWAFAGCSGITSVTIPKNLIAIGYRSFTGCSSLTDVYYGGNSLKWREISNLDQNPSMGNAVLHTAEMVTDYYVSGIKYDEYKTGYFAVSEIDKTKEYAVIEREIEGMPVDRILTGALETLIGIARIFIPSNIITIDDYAIETADAHIIYEGSLSSWKSINIGDGNDSLFDGTIHYTTSEYAYGSQVTPPTCQAQGCTTYTCKYCTDSYTANFTEKTDHFYDTTIIPPDCTADGYTIYDCIYCDNAYTSDFVPKPDHYVVDGICTECNGEFDVIESEHDYTPNTDKTWVVSVEGAEYITLKFSDKTSVEKRYDYIYIFDKDDIEIGKYTGTALASKEIIILGDTAKVKLQSDSMNQQYGFRAEYIASFTPYVPETTATESPTETTVLPEEPDIDSTEAPTTQPTDPTEQPSQEPTQPTVPTEKPTDPTEKPTQAIKPTENPTQATDSTEKPSHSPSVDPVASGDIWNEDFSKREYPVVNGYNTVVFEGRSGCWAFIDYWNADKPSAKFSLYMKWIEDGPDGEDIFIAFVPAIYNRCSFVDDLNYFETINLTSSIAVKSDEWFGSFPDDEDRNMYGVTQWFPEFYDYYTGEKVTPDPLTKPNQAPDPTEKPTQATKPTEKPTQATDPTEKPTQATKPTEKPTQATDPTEKPTQATKPTEPLYKVYFEDSLSWGNIHVYCYGGDGELLGKWPGKPCKYEGDKVWSIEFYGTPEAIIFHANDNANQTQNISFEGGNMKATLTGEWIRGDYKDVAVAIWQRYAPIPTTNTKPTTQPTDPTEQPSQEPTQPTVPAEKPTVPTEKPSQEPTQSTLPTEKPTTRPSEAPTEPEVTYLVGDANGDSKINVKDATLIQKAAASLATLDDTASKCADVNSDGNVNVKDATAIQKFAAGMDTGFSIGLAIKNEETTES